MKRFDPTKASKFMARLLRHDPGAAGLVLDSEGWTGTIDLLKALKAKGHNLNQSDLIELVASDGKSRYSLTLDNKRIRANQGHSTDQVALTFVEIIPPDVLYHGTVQRYIGEIFHKGLLKMNRHHVHLSEDLATATLVRSRHGNPVILVIDARRMTVDGYKFYLSSNNVWLANSVPAQYLLIKYE